MRRTISNQSEYTKLIAKNLIIVAFIMTFILFVYYAIEIYSISRAHVPALSIDYHIPYLEVFVVPYVFIFYSIIFYAIIFYSIEKPGKFIKFIYTFLLTNIIALVIYLIYPTINIIRPKKLPDTFLSRIMKNYYDKDISTNCLPSLHVGESWAITFNFLEDNDKKIAITTVLLAILISLSTIFVRQHYILDIPAGILVAFSAFLISKKISKQEEIYTPIEPSKIHRATAIFLIILQPLLTIYFLC